MPLPIEPLLPELVQRLPAGGTLLLQAPPGAGKTTGVPLALLEALPKESGRILMLEPRRLAAKAAAQRLASSLGEDVGQRIGYRVRLESRVSAATRVEVLTDGLFLRQLQSDPSLEGVVSPGSRVPRQWSVPPTASPCCRSLSESCPSPFWSAKARSCRWRCR